MARSPTQPSTAQSLRRSQQSLGEQSFAATDFGDVAISELLRSRQAHGPSTGRHLRGGRRKSRWPRRRSGSIQRGGGWLVAGCRLRPINDPFARSCTKPQILEYVRSRLIIVWSAMGASTPTDQRCDTVLWSTG